MGSLRGLWRWHRGGGTDIQLRVRPGEGFGRLYKCLANWNSKKTANTLSGTDSSHLVKNSGHKFFYKLSKIRITLTKKVVLSGMWNVFVCHCMLHVHCMYVCASEVGWGEQGEEDGRGWESTPRCCFVDSMIFSFRWGRVACPCLSCCHWGKDRDKKTF